MTVAELSEGASGGSPAQALMLDTQGLVHVSQPSPPHVVNPPRRQAPTSASP